MTRTFAAQDSGAGAGPEEDVLLNQELDTILARIIHLEELASKSEAKADEEHGLQDKAMRQLLEGSTERHVGRLLDQADERIQENIRTVLVRADESSESGPSCWSGWSVVDSLRMASTIRR